MRPQKDGRIDMHARSIVTAPSLLCRAAQDETASTKMGVLVCSTAGDSSR